MYVGFRTFIVVCKGDTKDPFKNEGPIDGNTKLIWKKNEKSFSTRSFPEKFALSKTNSSHLPGPPKQTTYLPSLNVQVFLLLVSGRFTLPETNIAHENPIFPGKYHQNGGFSMAMLVYRRVIVFKGTNKNLPPTSSYNSQGLRSSPGPNSHCGH